MNRFFRLLVVVLLVMSGRIWAQCPPNIGFENGKFDGWVCDSGRISSTGVISVVPSNPNPDLHKIISASNAGLDKYGHFPTLCPNGSKYSLKLGNDYGGNGAERVSYVYNVPANAVPTLVLNYAVVLGNPTGHFDFEQGRFTLKIFNVSDNTQIPCPELDFIAKGPGFIESDIKFDSNSGLSAVYYKQWSTTTINLSDYAGKQVRLEFTTTDCTKFDHFGYAYIDLDETCSELGPVTGNVFCEGQTAIALHGPTGFDTYTWYKGNDISQPPVGTGQNLVINGPVDQEEYTLAIGAYPGLGCPDTLHVSLIKKPAPFIMEIKEKLYGCSGTSVDLAAAIKTPGLDYSYHRDSNTLDYLPSPHAITNAGIYYIKGVSSPEGCTDIKPVEVIFLDAPVVTVVDPIPVQFPATVDISKVYNELPGVNYAYYSDSKAEIPIDNIVTTSGTYYIKATNSSTNEITCPGTLKPVKVIITPPAPYTISAPNTFTPNNDGINDDFTITVSGYITFGNFKIFNRYGSQVFTAKSSGENWRGMIGNKQLPVGTYYWIFEGADSYYKTPVRKSGSVTIIR